MKKTILILTALFTLLCGCQKSGIEAFRGNYSFKTGGYLEFKGEIKDDEGTHEVTVTRRILPENGQMHILPDGNGGVKVTMNITGGEPVVFDGSINGNGIVLSPIRRSVVILPDSDISDIKTDIVLGVSGKGSLFDNTIIIGLKYEGEYTTDDFTGKISESYVNCVATRNE